MINNFLEDRKKISNGEFKNYKKHLWDLFKYINKPIGEITPRDTLNYFKLDLDARKISLGKNKGTYLKLSSKETIRACLTHFFDYIGHGDPQNADIFNNPIPTKKRFKFTTRTFC